VAHLVWDWNGTLLDDLALVVDATNAALVSVGGHAVSVDEHRRDFHRPVSSYYAQVLGRPVSDEDFATLDRVFHTAYRAGLPGCRLASDALTAVGSWTGSQSLLSMFFHHELVPAVSRHGLDGHLQRVDGLRDRVGGGSKTPHLLAHLTALDLAGPDCVLIGDSVDDADAAVAVGARIVLYAGGITHETRLRETGLPVAATLVDAVSLALAA
jgi:phosphoglycolate phosphatase-like HAD superfamily hydrolase